MEKSYSRADKFEYRERMLRLHDELAIVNKKYQLERGEDIARTKAKHRTLEEYHQWEQKELKIKVENQQKTIKEQQEHITKFQVILKEQKLS